MSEITKQIHQDNAKEKKLSDACRVTVIIIIIMFDSSRLV